MDVAARLIALDTSYNVVRSFESSGSILLSGTVTYDRGRQVRRTCQVTLANATGLLSPLVFGDLFFTDSLIRLERSTGGTWSRLGTFRVSGFDSGMNGQLSIAGEDPFSFCQQALGDVVVLDATLTGALAMRKLLEPVLGDGSLWSLDDGGRLVGAVRSFAEDSDRLDSAVTLAADLGCELYCDRDGLPVLRPQPDPTVRQTDATYQQRAGVAVMTDLTRSGQARAFNRSIVIGTDSLGNPVRGQADVSDPSSPVHANTIGLRVAPIYRSAQITTQDQANAVALARLYQLALVQDAVGGTAIPDPDRNEGDVISFFEPISGTNDRYWIQQVTHPVTQGGMQLAGPRAISLFLS